MRGWLLAFTFLAGPAGAAVYWGAQCEFVCIGSGTVPQNTVAQVTGAGGYVQGFGGNAVRIRVTVEHPITDVATGLTCVPVSDLDPALANNTVPLVTGCAGNFAASGTATSDFWGGATVQYTKSSTTLTITSDGSTPVYPSYFIPATNNHNTLGAGNVVALSQAAGLFIDYTFLNSASINQASDDLIRDPSGNPCQTAQCSADFRANMLYTWKDIMATGGSPALSVWTIGNEETGGNGVTIGNATAIASGGSGYSIATTVSVAGPGTGFKGIVNVTAGAVTGVNVADGGSGWATPPAVSFSGGCTATATAVLNPISGAIRSVTVNSGGAGCSQGSQLTLNNNALINVLTVDGGGGILTWQYGNYPTIPVYGVGAVVPTATTGGGTGATFTFQLNNHGDYSGNETVGAYSAAEYQQKLVASVIAGHSVGVKVGDAGIQGLPLYLSYWNDQFYGPTPSATIPTPIGDYPTGSYPGSCGTLACRQNMDGLGQTFYSKNANQIDYGGGLPNSCGSNSNTLSPGQILSIQKFHALVGAEIAAKTDFQNFHWYQTVPYSTSVAIAWLKTLNGGLPLAINEAGEYGNSYADAANIAAGCLQMDAFECIWWNRNSGFNQRAIVMQYPSGYQVPVTATLNQNGQAWADVIAAITAGGALQPAPIELPLC